MSRCPACGHETRPDVDAALLEIARMKASGEWQAELDRLRPAVEAARKRHGLDAMADADHARDMADFARCKRRILDAMADTLAAHEFDEPDEAP